LAQESGAVEVVVEVVTVVVDMGAEVVGLVVDVILEHIWKKVLAVTHVQLVWQQFGPTKPWPPYSALDVKLSVTSYRSARMFQPH
jgi:hypothetical protein